MLYIGHVNGKSPNSYVLLIRILWFKMLLSNKWHPYELEILFQNNYFQSLTCAINSTLFDQLVHVVMGGEGLCTKIQNTYKFSSWKLYCESNSENHNQIWKNTQSRSKTACCKHRDRDRAPANTWYIIWNSINPSCLGILHAYAHFLGHETCVSADPQTFCKAWHLIQHL